MTTTNLSSMDSGQRVAIREQTNGLIATIKDTVERLNEIWDRVQMGEELREGRIHHVFQGISNTLKDTVIAEEEMTIGIEKDIIARRYMVQEMRAAFNMSNFEESPYQSGSIALLKALDHDLATLSDQKEKAMRVQLQLHQRIQSLCARLDLQMPEFEEITEKVYDTKRLDKMRALVPELCTTLKRRINKVMELQEESRKIYEALVPNASITNEEMVLLHTDFAAEEAIVSSDSIHQNETLNQKLKDEYDSWLEKVSSRYDELLIKMEELSKKCHLPVMKELNFDKDGVKNERDLQKLEENLQHIEEKYERSGPVFDKLNQWMVLWKEKLNGEKRVCRVSFYKNRGGSVNNAVKRQKQVDLQLPKMFAELRTMVEDYVREFGESDLLVEGQRPDQYIAGVIAAYEEEKEVQRVQKRFGRQNKYNPSTLSPSRTPVPFRTPMVRTGQPVTGVLGRKRNISITDMSEIHPVHGPIDGPRTSSPKSESNLGTPVKATMSRSKPMSAKKTVPDFPRSQTPKKW